MKIKVFISYSHIDEEFCVGIKKHFSSLENQGIITTWYDRDIIPGSSWEEEIQKNMENSNIILLLLSSDYFSSSYCFDTEIEQALDLRKKKNSIVIPIIVRPVNWIDSPLSSLQVLPKNGKAITKWENQDEAYLNIVDNIKKFLDIDTSILHIENSYQSFPFKNWKSINISHWLENTLVWFEKNFYIDNDLAFKELLLYLAEVINNLPADSSIFNIISEMGKGIAKIVNDSECPNKNHFLRISELIVLGLHHQHSHFFMLPEISITNLINIPDYSSLLLSTKYYASGFYNKAIDLSNLVHSNCSLAGYIVGQSYRKLGYYNHAEFYIDKAISFMNNWCHHVCQFNKDFSILCNRYLLEASLYRALAVIMRNLKDFKKAEENYRNAENILKSNKENLSVNTEFITSPSENNGKIHSSFNKIDCNTIFADIYYSIGYYWYENCNYSVAQEYFDKSISELRKSNCKWDPPFTRKAIIQLLEGNFSNSIKLFSEAYSICSETPVEKNREASLSKALCCLGLTILENSCPFSSNLSTTSPIEELNESLRLIPPLSLGPLECHRNDANMISERASGNVKQITKEFIYVIEQEINNSCSRIHNS